MLAHVEKVCNGCQKGCDAFSVLRAVLEVLRHNPSSMFAGINPKLAPEDKDAYLKLIRSVSDEDLYVAMLECQAKFCATEVRRTLGSLQLLRSATSVLDAGCGPGAFAEEFREFFETKAYLGIDLDADFVERARKRFAANPHFKFEQADLYSFSKGKYDAVILWAVLQHLPDTKKALDCLKAVATKGFIILDTRPDQYEFVSDPELPTLKSYFDLLQNLSKGRGRNTDCLLQAREWATGVNWEITLSLDFAPSAKVHPEKVVFYHYACLLTEFFKRKFNIGGELEKIATELEQWLRKSNSTVTFKGGLWLCVQPAASHG